MCVDRMTLALGLAATTPLAQLTTAARPGFKVQHHPLHATGAEEAVAVVDLARLELAVDRLSGEIGVERPGVTQTDRGRGEPG
jgi:hypothetical protein